jgi:cyclohexanecarboxylate-CoA ligase
MVSTHLGITRAGAVANPILPSYRTDEVGFMLGDADTRLYVVPESYRGFDYRPMAADLVGSHDPLERAVVVGDTDAEYDDRLVAMDAFATPVTPDPVETESDDILTLLYTSGTTGTPKGVLHTHDTLLSHNRNMVKLHAFSSETTVLMPSSVAHVIGLLYAVQLPFVLGMEVVMMDRWDAERAVDLIDAFDCNVTIGPTTFLRGLLDAAPQGWENSLRLVSVGGSKGPSEIVYRATDELGCTVKRAYGSSEYPTCIANPLDAPIDKQANTEGIPSDGCRISVRDPESGEPVPRGESGELFVQGPGLMVGYNDRELNDEAFDEGWYGTGDLARVDDRGYVAITGRKKDVIIRGGENIAIQPIDDVLHEHPAITDVAVVAMPDPDLGEKACAYVELDDDTALTFESMIDFLESRDMTKQKYPERLEVVDELDRTETGKIDRKRLREDVAAKLGLEPVSR